MHREVLPTPGNRCQTQWPRPARPLRAHQKRPCSEDSTSGEREGDTVRFMAHHRNGSRFVFGVLSREPRDVPLALMEEKVLGRRLLLVSAKGTRRLIGVLVRREGHAPRDKPARRADS